MPAASPFPSHFLPLASPHPLATSLARSGLARARPRPARVVIAKRAPLQLSKSPTTLPLTTLYYWSGYKLLVLKVGRAPHHALLHRAWASAGGGNAARVDIARAPLLAVAGRRPARQAFYSIRPSLSAPRLAPAPAAVRGAAARDELAKTLFAPERATAACRAQATTFALHCPE